MIEMFCVKIDLIVYIDTLKKQIGSGGFSEVFLVDNPKIKRPIAMKIMKISDEEK
jgi:serine/threonine protein kinase